MANSFGSLWVGASGIQAASHGLNTTANNLSNANTKGYVREQVVYEDRDYRTIGYASVSDQYSGLGVQVGTIVHARDVFLDKAYRTESGRLSFYEASAEAVEEVETFLQEHDGEAFRDAIADFYSAFAEFAKDPSDTVNQNLVMQKASLFLSRAATVNTGLYDYQKIINSKIKENVERINAIGKEIVELNKRVQAIEAAGVEKAMDLRDTRDLLLDELSGLARISYEEDATGNVHVEIEGVEFVDEVRYNEIGLYRDDATGYVTPYWTQLSNLTEGEEVIYAVFGTETVNGVKYISNVSAAQSSDVGIVKALLMARGNGHATYLDYRNISEETYEKNIGNSVMMNTEAELDTLIHQMVTTINDLFSPLAEAGEVYKDAIQANNADSLWFYNEKGEEVKLETTARVCDVNNADVGSDGKLPPRELFVRKSEDRYETRDVYMKDVNGDVIVDDNGNPIKMTVYVYNEEDPELTGKCYTLNAIEVNPDLVEAESYLPFRKNSDETTIDYALGTALEKAWTEQSFNLNPSDKTPCNFREFYTKWIGEIGTMGSVYSTTADALSSTSEQIEFSRQGVIGVSSDEELTNMIKYQNAYNAASRYINVVNEMIEHLLNSLAG